MVAVREEVATGPRSARWCTSPRRAPATSPGCWWWRRWPATSPPSSAATVEALLPDHDVYITDWHNARDVGLDHGRFGFDEYIAAHDRLPRAGSAPGPTSLAVCQPCPATLAAVAVMAEAGHPAMPQSLTLMAGPVDTRVSPTEVNELAQRQPIEWFEHNVITTGARCATRGRCAGSTPASCRCRHSCP